MKWLQAELYGKIQIGEDKLRNPVHETKKICNFLVRFTPWNIEEITALGNTYTICRRKMLTRASENTFRVKKERDAFFYINGENVHDYEHCTIFVDNNEYTIESIKKLNDKFVLLTIKAVKL